MTYQNQYYLVIQPLSEGPDELAPYFASLSHITELDKFTLKQKLTGNALQILHVSQDQYSLEQMSEGLKKEGFFSTVISKEEIQRPMRPRRCSRIEIEQKSLTFFSPTSEVLLTFMEEQKCLIVLATMSFRGLQKKRLARKALNIREQRPLKDILRYIFAHQPLLDIYIFDADSPIRIDSTKFNYTSLGEANRNSAALNVPKGCCNCP